MYDPKTIREEEVKVTDAFSNLVEDQKRLQRKRRSASELLLEDQAESRTPNNSTSRSASKRKVDYCIAPSFSASKHSLVSLILIYVNTILLIFFMYTFRISFGYDSMAFITVIMCFAL